MRLLKLFDLFNSLTLTRRPAPLVALEDVAGVNFVLDVVEDGVVAVGDDGMALSLEVRKVIDYLGTEEGGAVLEGGLIDDDLGTLGLDTLHDALDGGLTEVVGVGLHGQTVHTDDTFLLCGRVVLAGLGVVTCLPQYLVGNEVLAGAVALDNGGHHVLRYLGIVGEQLLGVLG